MYDMTVVDRDGVAIVNGLSMDQVDQVIFTLNVRVKSTTEVGGVIVHHCSRATTIVVTKQ